MVFVTKSTSPMGLASLLKQTAISLVGTEMEPVDGTKQNCNWLWVRPTFLLYFWNYTNFKFFAEQTSIGIHKNFNNMHVNISAKLKMLNSNYPYLLKRLLVYVKKEGKFHKIKLCKISFKFKLKKILRKYCEFHFSQAKFLSEVVFRLWRKSL